MATKKLPKCCLTCKHSCYQYVIDDLNDTEYYSLSCSGGSSRATRMEKPLARQFSLHSWDFVLLYPKEHILAIRLDNYNGRGMIDQGMHPRMFELYAAFLGEPCDKYDGGTRVGEPRRQHTMDDR